MGTTSAQWQFYLLSVFLYTSCHQRDSQTFARKNTVVLEHQCATKHTGKRKREKKREHILLLSDFCVFTDQSKAFLFNQNLTSTCLWQSVPLCYSFSWEIGSRARDLPVFHIHLSRRHHRVCRLVVFIKRKSLFSVRRGHESQQDFDEPKRLP